MIGKHTRYAALAIAAIACIAEAFAASRYEQEIEDYIVVDNAANIVQLTAIGSGPNPPLASQAQKPSFISGAWPLEDN